jgi:hypothetical protein
MNQKIIIIRPFVTILFVIVFCGINITNVIAQSTHIMKYLPRSPLLLKEVEPPKASQGTLRIQLNNKTRLSAIK